MKCFWIFGHDWTMWEVIHHFVSEKWGAIEIKQQRTCKCCGLTEIKSESC